ncbi:MAG: sugar transferase [Pirellulaceae bacterium]
MATIEIASKEPWNSTSMNSLSSQYCCHVATHESPFYTRKGVVDRLLGLALLILAAPVIGALVLAIRWSSKGPGIYSQARVGRGGRLFTMYKLRSMRADAEVGIGPAWAAAGDDKRITRLGYWLRKLHLDELPQLWNLVRGEMSLVGPRPERPEFVAVLAEQIPGYLDRLRIAPGITGLAQINLPPDTDLNSVRRKLVLDTEYIRTAGMLLDLRIAACTLLRLVGLRGGRAVVLLGLWREVELPALSVTAAAGGGPTTISVIVNRAAIEGDGSTPRREAEGFAGEREELEPSVAVLVEAESCAS